MAYDSTLLTRFLRGEIDGRTFRHADHLRAGFELLEAQDFSTAAHSFTTALKTIAGRAGNPGAYHETITLAFLSLIAERREAGGFADFDAFADANPDLMDKTVLERWYAPERLRSDIARRVFVLPDAAR
jgi:hypothetical protein